MQQLLNDVGEDVDQPDSATCIDANLGFWQQDHDEGEPVTSALRRGWRLLTRCPIMLMKLMTSFQPKRVAAWHEGVRYGLLNVEAMSGESGVRRGWTSFVKAVATEDVCIILISRCGAV